MSDKKKPILMTPASLGNGPAESSSETPPPGSLGLPPSTGGSKKGIVAILCLLLAIGGAGFLLTYLQNKEKEKVVAQGQELDDGPRVLSKPKKKEEKAPTYETFKTSPRPHVSDIPFTKAQDPELSRFMGRWVTLQGMVASADGDGGARMEGGRELKMQLLRGSFEPFLKQTITLTGFLVKPDYFQVEGLEDIRESPEKERGLVEQERGPDKDYYGLEDLPFVLARSGEELTVRGRVLEVRLGGYDKYVYLVFKNQVSNDQLIAKLEIETLPEGFTERSFYKYEGKVITATGLVEERNSYAEGVRRATVTVGHPDALSLSEGDIEELVEDKGPEKEVYGVADLPYLLARHGEAVTIEGEVKEVRSGGYGKFVYLIFQFEKGKDQLIARIAVELLPSGSSLASFKSYEGKNVRVSGVVKEKHSHRMKNRRATVTFVNPNDVVETEPEADAEVSASQTLDGIVKWKDFSSVPNLAGQPATVQGKVVKVRKSKSMEGIYLIMQGRKFRVFVILSTVDFEEGKSAKSYKDYEGKVVKVTGVVTAQNNFDQKNRRVKMKLATLSDLAIIE